MRAPGSTQRTLESLGMADAGARHHPVDLARTNALLHAGAVAMGDLAFEQVCQRREAYVGMGPHVGASRRAMLELGRSHVIEEHKGTDGAPLGEWKNAGDFKAAKIFPNRVDDHFQHAQHSDVSAHNLVQ